MRKEAFLRVWARVSKSGYIKAMLYVGLIVLLLAVKNRFEYSEQHELVILLEQFEPIGECEYSISETSPWISLLGGPPSVSVSLRTADDHIVTKTSGWSLPTRVSVRGVYFYHFEWSDLTNGKERASYMDMEVSREGKVEWIEIGECASADGRVSYFGWAHRACAPRTRTVRCDA